MKSHMKKLAIPLTICLGLSACNSGINKEVAIKHGLNPESSIKAPDGGCIPELVGKRFPQPDGSYGEFVSGLECYATKVYPSPAIKEGQRPTKEFVFMHGDGHSAGGVIGVYNNFNHIINQTIIRKSFFWKNPYQIRLVSRIGHQNPFGTTSGTLAQYGTNSYTDHNTKSYAQMIKNLASRNTAEQYVLYGFSGGATIMIAALSKYADLVPNSVVSAHSISGFCDTGIAQAYNGFRFTGAVNSIDYVKNISSNIRVTFNGSDGDRVAPLSGMKICFEEMKANGHTNVTLNSFKDIEHMEMIESYEVLGQSIYTDF